MALTTQESPASNEEEEAAETILHQLLDMDGATLRPFQRKVCGNFKMFRRVWMYVWVLGGVREAKYKFVQILNPRHTPHIGYRQSHGGE